MIGGFYMRCNKSRLVWYIHPDSSLRPESAVVGYDKLLDFATAQSRTSSGTSSISMHCIETSELNWKKRSECTRNRIFEIKFEKYFCLRGGTAPFPDLSTDSSPVGRETPSPHLYYLRRLDPRAYRTRPWPLPFTNPGSATEQGRGNVVSVAWQLWPMLYSHWNTSN